MTMDEIKALIDRSVEKGRQAAIQEMAERREATVTRQDAARQLHVSVITLWRWAKTGYLKPVKVGKTILYHQADIDMILHNVQPQAAI